MPGATMYAILCLFSAGDSCTHPTDCTDTCPLTNGHWICKTSECVCYEGGHSHVIG